MSNKYHHYVMNGFGVWITHVVTVVSSFLTIQISDHTKSNGAFTLGENKSNSRAKEKKKTREKQWSTIELSKPN